MRRWLLSIPCLLPFPCLAGAVNATLQVGQRAQIILNGVINTSMPLTPDVPVWDLDMFDTPASAIATLKSKGKFVICYFSAGTYENWRSDASKFNSNDLGKPLASWAGEQWLNVRSNGVKDVMAARIKLAASKGCDAIDPDNIGMPRLRKQNMFYRDLTVY
jgi:hypothetical protein